MGEPTLSQWLNRHMPTGFSCGQEVYAVHKSNSGLEVLELRVSKIGRKFITTSLLCEQKFGVVSLGTPYLLEECSFGHPDHLYFRKSDAQQEIKGKELALEFRKNYEKWLQNTSCERIEVALGILNGTVSDAAMEVIRDVIAHEPITGPVFSITKHIRTATDTMEGEVR